MYNNGGFHLSQKRLSIATVLQRNGFITAAMHSNPMLSAQFGYNTGFDYFWDTLQNTGKLYRAGSDLAPHVQRLGGIYEKLRKIYHMAEVASGKPPFIRAEALLHKAQKWMQETCDRTRSFFLWLHLMDLHNPYLPLIAYRRKFLSQPLSTRRLFELTTQAMDNPDTLSAEEVTILRRLYQAQVNYVDDKLGEFINWLDKDQISDNTLLVVTADHGEEFGEHGSVGHAAYAHQIQNGKVSVKLYDELLHVPLILYASAPSLGHRCVSEMVSLIDLSPTIIELLGLPQVPEWQGESLVPLMSGAGHRSTDGVFAEYEVRGDNGLKGVVVAYRTHEWKFIYDSLFGKHELYALPKDPREHDNVLSSYPHIARQMQWMVEQHLFSLQSDSAPTMTEPDEEVLRRLKALGYIE